MARCGAIEPDVRLHELEDGNGSILIIDEKNQQP